eukprot:gene4835-34588_t
MESAMVLGPLSGFESQTQDTMVDEEMSAIMSQLLLDQIDAKSAVAAMESMCNRRAQALRDAMSLHMPRPARHMRLKALAAEMEAQARTWHLLWCLHCNEMAPAGTGGPEVIDAGGRRTHRQMVADLITTDPLLTRLGNVVSWLESIADDTLSQNPAPRFADTDGVWLETKYVLGQAGTVTQLRPHRQSKALGRDSATGDERLMMRLWQLVRAGRVAEARTLCRQCGQPWRSVSLGGTGEYGPLPVGVAANLLEEEMDEGTQMEDMAVEVDLGLGNLRALWKQSCLVASEAPASSPKFEAALYGALCGNLSAVLPVCNNWEDACWAYCRAWLDLRTDDLIRAERQSPQDLIGGDILVNVLKNCGIPASKASAAVEASLSSAIGCWPPHNLTLQAGIRGATAGGTTATLAQTFDEVFDALNSSPVPALAQAGHEKLRQVQQLLIKDSISALVLLLYEWLVAKESGSTPEGMLLEASGEDAEAAEIHGLLPTYASRMSSFAAHLMLAMEALGVFAQTSEDTFEVSRISSVSEQVVALYVAGLIERGRLSLVPQYLPHLKEPLKEILSHELMQQLTNSLVGLEGGARPSSQAVDATPGAVYCCMEEWFGHCFQRQHSRADLMDEGEAQANFMVTHVRDHETRLQMLTFYEKSRFSPSLGPLHRSRASRWAFFPFLAATSSQAFTEGDGSFEAIGVEAYVFGDALRLCVDLCREFALGGPVAASAGWELFERVIPEGFERGSATYIEEMLERVTIMEATSSHEGDQGSDAIAELDSQCSFMRSATAELAQWRLYFTLDHEFVQWDRQYNAVHGGLGQSGTSASAATPAPPTSSALAVAPPPGSADDLERTARSLLASYVEEVLKSGWMEGHWSADSEAPTLVELHVTSKEFDVEGGESANSLLFPVMKGARLYDLESRLRMTLGSIERQFSDSHQEVGAKLEVTSPESAEGFVTIRLSFSHASPQASQLATELVVSLLDGSYAELPDVTLVNFESDCKVTGAESCRRSCLGQVVLRCCLLRQALVALGDDGSQGSDLVALLAGASGQAPLMDVLSPSMLEQNACGLTEPRRTSGPTSQMGT